MTRDLIPAGRLPRGAAVPRLLGLIALALGLFMTVAGAYLTWNTMRANNALDRAEQQAGDQAEAVRAVLASIESAFSAPAVTAAARGVQRGDTDRDVLLEALRDAGIRNVLHLINASAPLETTDLDALPGGGFATLDMLLEAGEAGRAPAQAHFAGTSDEYLALAHRLDDDQQPTVVLWLALPMTMVTNQLERPEGVDGLALRQDSARGTVELLSLGSAVPGQARSVPIPGSRFEVAWQRAQVLGPMSLRQLGGLAGAGLLMLVLGGLLIHRSRQSAREPEPDAVEAEAAPIVAPTRPAPAAKKSEPREAIDATEESEDFEDRPGDEHEPSNPDAHDPENELGPLLDSLNEEADALDARPTEDDAAETPSEHEETPELEAEDGFTADGEPRRSSGPTRALDAPELGSFGASDAEAAESEVEDEADAAESDVDEQAEMGEMLRALVDGGEDSGRAERPQARPASDSGPTSAPVPGITVPDASIFRAYDIRGVVGDTLDEGVAEAIGRAIGSEARDRNLSRIAVARDGRLSGAQMLAALSRGLVATGLEVIEVGAVPTPVLYYAAQEIGGGSGVMVTGSHNPPDYNGFKIVLGGETLSGDSIRALHRRLAEGRLVEGQGQLGEQRINSRYMERIGTDIQLEKALKVVVDCGNGIAGAIAPKLLESIGADVIPLYAEVDGSFPNHHPDPGDPKTLEDLRLCVRNFEAEVGIAFDGDGDRLGVVGPDGEVIYPDRLMMLFARDVLSRNEGAEIIYDVKCSSLLAGEIEAAGGRPVMARTGHSFIKAELKQRQAPLAGEMSGHFFFSERWFGFDDGLYAAARLLEILAADTRATGQIFADLPKAESTPELKVPMKEGQPHAFVKAFAEKASFEGASINTIDGVRADFEDGFGLVRASNTTPVLVLRFEGTSKESLNRIQGSFREAMLAINPALKLPF